MNDDEDYTTKQYIELSNKLVEDLDKDIGGIELLHKSSSSPEELFEQLQDNHNTINVTEDEFNAYYEQVYLDSIANAEIQGELDDLEGLAEAIEDSEFTDDLLTKDTIVSKVNEERSKQYAGQSLPINLWVERNVTKIEKMKSTDSNVNAKYIFYFDGTDKTWETETGFLSWDTFSTAIFNATTDNVRMYEFGDNEYDKYSNPWIGFIKDFISQNYQEVSVPGGRTQCLEYLFHEKVQRAHYNKNEAYGKGIPFYDDDYLYVHSQTIQSAVNEYGLKTEQVQAELSANIDVNKYDSYDGGGFSQTKYINLGEVNENNSLNNDTRVRYWAIPKEYVDSMTNINYIENNENETINTTPDALAEEIEQHN